MELLEQEPTTLFGEKKYTSVVAIQDLHTVKKLGISLRDKDDN